MSTEKKTSTEADDVFEFLDSLPQDAKKGKTNDNAADQGSDNKKNTGGAEPKKKDDDIFEFLEELEKTSKKDVTENRTTTPVKKEEKKKEVAEPETKSVEEPKKEEKLKEETKQVEEDAIEGEPLNDPINAISNWWSSSGSSKVSSLWSKTTEQASQFKDKLVDTTQQSAAVAQSTGMLPPIDLSSITTNLNKDNLMNLTDQITKNLTKIVVGDTEEVLRIHLVHDLINVSYLPMYVEEKFDQVMSSQVEGGIRIFVDEWGKPNKNGTDLAGSNDNTTINDAVDQTVKLNAFQGKVNDGDKLAFANLDNSIDLFNKAHAKILEQNESEATQEKTISDIFISILPIALPSGKTTAGDDTIVTTDSNSPGNFYFTIVLKDVTNDVTSITRSQGFPMKWIDWLEGSKINNVDKEESDEKKDEESTEQDDDEEDITVDPSEWVQQWIEDGISLAFGVVAQNYVVERMGF